MNDKNREPFGSTSAKRFGHTDLQKRIIELGRKGQLTAGKIIELFGEAENKDATRPNIRCDCCNRPVEELKPFGGPGDPLVGDFTGRRLVKVWRYDFSEHGIPTDYFDCLTKNGEIDEQEFTKKYGRKKYEQTCEFLARMTIVSSYWLCRDCILIEDKNEFCKKRDNCSEKAGIKKNRRRNVIWK